MTKSSLGYLCAPNAEHAKQGQLERDHIRPAAAAPVSLRESLMEVRCVPKADIRDDQKPTFKR